MQRSRSACLVCGFPLGIAPWHDNSASYQICPSCGIHFGYDDRERTHDQEAAEDLYRAWRRWWIDNGMQWWGRGQTPPPDWNPISQLRQIGIDAVSGEGMELPVRSLKTGGTGHFRPAIVPPEVLLHALVAHALRVIGDLAEASGDRRSAEEARLCASLLRRLSLLVQGAGTSESIFAQARVFARRRGIAEWFEGLVEAETRRAASAASLDTGLLLYQLLHLALIELRATAYMAGNKEVWAIADIFHNVPTRLARVSRAEGSADELLARVRQRAERRGMTEWLAEAIDDARREITGDDRLPPFRRRW